MCLELWQILRGELDSATADRLIARIRTQLGGQRVYLPHPERPSKRQIAACFAATGDWRAVHRQLGVSRRTAYRYR